MTSMCSASNITEAMQSCKLVVKLLTTLEIESSQQYFEQLKKLVILEPMFQKLQFITFQDFQQIIGSQNDPTTRFGSSFKLIIPTTNSPSRVHHYYKRHKKSCTRLVVIRSIAIAWHGTYYKITSVILSVHL